MDHLNSHSLIVPRIILLVVDLYGLMALRQVVQESPDEARITAGTVILLMVSAMVVAVLLIGLLMVAP